jgi:hypothetical protein
VQFNQTKKGSAINTANGGFSFVCLGSLEYAKLIGATWVHSAPRQRDRAGGRLRGLRVYAFRWPLSCDVRTDAALDEAGEGVVVEPTRGIVYLMVPAGGIEMLNIDNGALSILSVKCDYTDWRHA